MGLEPTTSWLPAKRSSHLSYIPLLMTVANIIIQTLIKFREFEIFRIRKENIKYERLILHEMHKLLEIKSRLNEGLEVFDDELDFLLDPAFQPHADRHFTSIHIAQMAVAFLTASGQHHILDIGSGTGKFCLIGGMMSSSLFTGIEYRGDFVQQAKLLASKAELTNVNFIHANLIDCSFKHYSAFYMFNPFLEQIDATATMNSGAEPSARLYRKYHNHVAHQLDNCLIGTRLVTYYVNEKQIPTSFLPVKKMYQGTLIFWEKVE